jgi:para-nitrobenzyl esterase
MALRAAFALCLALCLTSAVQADEAPPRGPLVRIETGWAEGRVEKDGVRAFLGLRYAAPPTGALRWRPPQPAPMASEVIHADRFGPECPQPLRRHDLNHYFGEEPTGEDCLFVNVWVPAGLKAGDKAPVVVFIHGGGFTIGSSGMALYSGAGLAAHGAVAVTLNYRLGALGFLAHPEAVGEAGSGDFGLMDQVAALGWVHRNIAAFGGDPDHVLVSGQSAGAISVALLEESGEARGLFARAAVMSGPPKGLFRPISAEEATANALALQKALGAASLDEMRALAADKVTALQADCQLGCSGSIRFGPYVDGRFVHPREDQTLRAAVPTLLGHTRDESLGFFGSGIGTPTAAAAYVAALRLAYGAAADKALALYPAPDPQALPATLSLMAKERGMEAADLDFAARLEAAGVSVRLYEFAQRHPYSPNARLKDQDPRTIGVYHTSDTPYWLGTQDALNLMHPSRDWRDEDRALSLAMSRLLIAFARGDAPASKGFSWPAWTRSTPQEAVFGPGLSVRRFDPVRLRALHDLPAPEKPVPAAPTTRPRD